VASNSRRGGSTPRETAQAGQRSLKYKREEGAGGPSGLNYFGRRWGTSVGPAEPQKRYGPTPYVIDPANPSSKQLRPQEARRSSSIRGPMTAALTARSGSVRTSPSPGWPADRFVRLHRRLWAKTALLSPGGALRHRDECGAFLFEWSGGMEQIRSAEHGLSRRSMASIDTVEWRVIRSTRSATGPRSSRLKPLRP
jgi:hypothetical protein